MPYEKISLHTDGGARGNPGPAGIGAVISEKSEGQEPAKKKYSEYIGKATNNQAEYKALILGLEKARDLGAREISCYLDSELVVRQMKGEYKVKNKDLAPLFVRVWNLSQGFAKVRFFHVPREENKEADKLVNEAIDRETKL